MSREFETPRTLTAEVRTYYPMGSLRVAYPERNERLVRENPRLAPRIFAVDQHRTVTPIILPAVMRRRIYNYIKYGLDQDSQQNCEDFAYAVNGIRKNRDFAKYAEDWSARDADESLDMNRLPIGSTVLFSTEPYDSTSPHLVHWYIVCGNGYAVSKSGNFGGVEVAQQQLLLKKYPYQYRYVMTPKQKEMGRKASIKNDTRIAQPAQIAYNTHG